MPKRVGKSLPKRKARPEVNKRLVERYYNAWNTLNTDNPASFYAQDAKLVFFDVVPLKYNGWAEYKEGVQKAFFDKISAGRLTPNDDLKITRRGDVAWMTLTFHLSFTLKTGGAIEIDCRHTAIWARRGGKWLIVHEHVSAPLPG
jgi:ketosteroid isomerase-like protein